MARHIPRTKTLTLLPLAGIVAGILQLPHIIVFAINIFALAVLLDWINRSINAISVNTGRFTNELLKGTLGNAVELMVNTHSSYCTVGEHYTDGMGLFSGPWADRNKFCNSRSPSYHQVYTSGQYSLQPASRAGQLAFLRRI